MQTFWHRVKSFLITFLSLAVSAFIAVIASDQGIAAIAELKTYIISLGVPASAVVLFGLFISELFRAWRNRQNLKKVGGRLGSHSVELY